MERASSAARGGACLAAGVAASVTTSRLGAGDADAGDATASDLAAFIIPAPAAEPATPAAPAAPAAPPAATRLPATSDRADGAPVARSRKTDSCVAVRGVRT